MRTCHYAVAAKDNSARGYYLTTRARYLIWRSLYQRARGIFLDLTNGGAGALPGAQLERAERAPAAEVEHQHQRAVPHEVGQAHATVGRIGQRDVGRR